MTAAATERTVGTPVFVGVLFALCLGVVMLAYVVGQAYAGWAFHGVLLVAIAGCAGWAWWSRRGEGSW